LSYKASYRVERANGGFEYLLGAAYQNQGVYFDANDDLVGVDNTQGDLMDSQGYDFFGKVSHWFSDEQHITAEVNRFKTEGDQNYISVAGDRDEGIASTSIEGTPVGLAPRNVVLTVGVNYQHDNVFGMKLNAHAYSQSFEGRFGATLTETFQDENIAPRNTLYDQSQTSSEKLGAKITLSQDQLLNDTLTLTGGIDLLTDTTDQTLELTGRTWVPESTFNNYAPFLQAEFRPFSSLVLHTGVRHEEAELEVDSFQTVASADSVMVEGGNPEFSETLLSAGAVITASEWLSVFVNYSEGFGMPDVGRVLRAINQPNLSVDEFLNLEPILTDNREIGFRVNSQTVDFELSYYQSDSDLGSRLQLIDGIYFVRREKTEIDGYEATFKFRAHEQHRLELSYSNINGKFDSDDDGSVDRKLEGLNISPDRLIASWSATWSDKLISRVQINHAFDRSFDTPEKEFSGYSLLDLSVAYQLPVGQFSVAIANALNEDYNTYYSQSAVVSDTRYFKGRGRTLSLNYAIDF
jgi:iron complex outermembrane recepter protein